VLQFGNSGHDLVWATRIGLPNPSRATGFGNPAGAACGDWPKRRSRPLMPMKHYRLPHWIMILIAPISMITIYLKPFKFIQNRKTKTRESKIGKQFSTKKKPNPALHSDAKGSGRYRSLHPLRR